MSSVISRVFWANKPSEPPTMKHRKSIKNQKEHNKYKMQLQFKRNENKNVQKIQNRFISQVSSLLNFLCGRVTFYNREKKAYPEIPAKCSSGCGF